MVAGPSSLLQPPPAFSSLLQPPPAFSSLLQPPPAQGRGGGGTPPCNEGASQPRQMLKPEVWKVQSKGIWEMGRTWRINPPPTSHPQTTQSHGFSWQPLQETLHAKGAQQSSPLWLSLLVGRCVVLGSRTGVYTPAHNIVPGTQAGTGARSVRQAAKSKGNQKKKKSLGNLDK